MTDPNYERPNDKWICGHASKSNPCRIGPSQWGRCRATFECQPVKEGSRWRCTRPKSAGGPCAEGPRPDGKCCRPIPRCQPVRSLRAKRGLVTWWTVAATTGVLLITLGGSRRGSFVSPRPLSAVHTKLDCAACHVSATNNLMLAAVFADAAPLRPVMTRLDQSCLRCHTGHDFHNAKAPFKFSCTTCHDEHSGPGRMPEPADGNCAHCHGDAALMKVAFTSFANHPPFHPSSDANTLKFNHQKHLTGDIPLLNGHKLDCADCHKPDATGTYMQPTTYEANCRSCHALQFDLHNPELVIPHGNATAARAFLHSLPTQYADLAARKKQRVEEFVARQMLQIREQARTGEDLERAVFFNTARTGPDGRPRYPGCAYCHDVKAAGEVTASVMPARWLTGGRFDHAKHRTVSCEKCHDVRRSRDTGDVLLPARTTCASCHSPAGGVADSCSTCHTYHFTAMDFAGIWRTADARREK